MKYLQALFNTENVTFPSPFTVLKFFLRQRSNTSDVQFYHYIDLQCWEFISIFCLSRIHTFFFLENALFYIYIYIYKDLSGTE
jgi:hypothetical protein